MRINELPQFLVSFGKVSQRGDKTWPSLLGIATQYVTHLGITLVDHFSCCCITNTMEYYYKLNKNYNKRAKSNTKYLRIYY